MAPKRSLDVTGATVSEEQRGRLTSEKQLDLQDLPEGCISHVISLTSPPDACRLSLLSRVIKSAAESDAVWDKFIPPDTHAILSQSNSLPFSKSKKELYMTLCDNPVLIEDGNMSFSLDKWSGKKCYMIAAKRLRIAWDNTAPYWRRKSLTSNQSRFKDASEQYGMVGWFEIRGRIETRMLSPCTTYKAYLVYNASSEVFNSYHLGRPVVVTVGARAYGFDYECPGLQEQTAGMKRTSFLSRRRDLEAEIAHMERRFGRSFQNQGR
ncbi:PREDICTED: F-box protein At2g02240-like [Fragaria vesca subsp. vesca]|uniref:F-box protein At2g02240-like n=1 Tax=Fragaria vesca subsp. vesca TaxID=101020 RepID=UPI0002C369BE|nr:PREDICTED: F-box protein At2g02240-like [Fragaria vesca subsp. vesca]